MRMSESNVFPHKKLKKRADHTTWLVSSRVLWESWLGCERGKVTYQIGRTRSDALFNSMSVWAALFHVRVVLVRGTILERSLSNGQQRVCPALPSFLLLAYMAQSQRSWKPLLDTLQYSHVLEIAGSFFDIFFKMTGWLRYRSWLFVYKPSPIVKDYQK